ncbi:MAG: ABC transporter ATP-binding protein, partial [Pseudonocardia sp.]
MSHVSVSGLTRRFDGNPPTVAVADLDLDIEDGEFLVLLGPSGCGKTTTLRCLAGLETPSAGTIRLGDSVVYDQERRINLPPNKRYIGMVFQSYALWPHMTVGKNIAYPLKARRMKAELAAGQVEKTAALVDCQNLLDRFPAQLSGGQQQRVALARGLVAQPDLVLFDEP